MMKKIVWLSLMMLAAALLVAACGPAVAPAVAPASSDTEVGEESADQPEVETTDSQPTKLKIAIANQTTIEQPWNTAMVQALERVIEEKPHDLEISYFFVENVADPDAERVLRELANTGDYGIIISHGVYVDAVEKLHKEFPEIVWVGTGAGWTAMGDNMYWFEMSIHEPAYLAGMVAGKMTETNTVGAVGAFPFPNVNAPINAFFEGARSVNPDIEIRMSYIDSWFDPPKAKESAAAQIAAGADVIYAERFGPFEAIAEADGYAVGHFLDQHELAPEVVLTSPMALWDPSIKYAIDRWWDHEVDGVPYEAPSDYIIFLMAEGGADLASYHSFEEIIPQEVKEAVEETRQQIIDGAFEVPFNDAPVETQ